MAASVWDFVLSTAYPSQLFHDCITEHAQSEWHQSEPTQRKLSQDDLHLTGCSVSAREMGDVKALAAAARDENSDPV